MKTIEWRNGSNGLRRAQFRSPGYDCRTECGHEQKGKHGWHCDEWHYIVGNGRAALSLEVFSSQFADDAKLTAEWNGKMREAAHGATLNMHLSWATNEDTIRAGDKPTPCEYVDGGCFAGGTTYTGAHELFAQNGNTDSIEQNDVFWLALERRFAEWFAEEDAKPRRHRCAACNGEGTITLTSPATKAGR